MDIKNPKTAIRAVMILATSLSVAHQFFKRINTLASYQKTDRPACPTLLKRSYCTTLKHPLKIGCLTRPLSHHGHATVVSFQQNLDHERSTKPPRVIVRLRLFGTMRAAFPTTRPSHAARKLRECLLDTDISRLRFFPGRNPANPLITRKRRNVLPYRPRRRRCNNGLLYIRWHSMHRPGGDSFFDHTIIVSNPLLKNL